MDKKKLLLQARFMKRAGKARFFAKLLFLTIPLLVSAALWSDPKIAAKLQVGLDVSKDMLGYGGGDADEAAQTASADQAEQPRVGQLPASRVQVNRLTTDKP